MNSAGGGEINEKRKKSTNFDGEKDLQILKRKNLQILLGRSNLQFQILEQNISIQNLQIQNLQNYRKEKSYKIREHRWNVKLGRRRLVDFGTNIVLHSSPKARTESGSRVRGLHATTTPGRRPGLSGGSRKSTTSP